MMKNLRKLAVLLLACGAFSASQADSVVFGGETITYSGATVTTVGEDLVLTFTDPATTGTFTVPASANAKARLLLVGGGGAGGSVSTSYTGEHGAGGGGGAGGFSDEEIVFPAGTYEVTVGAGGARVETVGTKCWVGESGKDTFIRLAGQTSGYTASVLGGGGGGAPKLNGQGQSGGSGGGGSWYKELTLKGGGGTEGYGWAGGTPYDSDYGGGGGGAALDGASGHGGRNTGRAGAGRASDITGTSVTYAAGGRGGARNDSSYAVASGSLPGNGGDGAVSGQGGAGANGIAVVRITKLFTYQTVDIPTYNQLYSWTNGNTYTALTLTAEQQAAMTISGTNSVTCSYTNNGDGTITTNGMGRFEFTLSLKDGYKWNTTDAGGETADILCAWRVREPDLIGVASIEVDKTVAWGNDKDARIAINVHLTPEKRSSSVKTLVLGTLCGRHGFKTTVANAALNAIATVSDVDWYFFNLTSPNYFTSFPEAYAYDAAAYFTGSLSKGESRASDASVPALTVSGGTGKKSSTASGMVVEVAGGTLTEVSIDSTSGNHGTLYGFYRQLYDLIQSGEASKYQYIVFSFDRGRVGDHFAQVHPHEAEVAAFLKPYYDAKRVIWLVDSKDGSTTDTSTAKCNSSSVSYSEIPWRPNVLVANSEVSTTWRTLDWMVANRPIYSTATTWVSDGTYGYNIYNAMMGLFDPNHYPVNQSTYLANQMLTDGSITLAKVQATQGDINENQVVYDDADRVSDFIKKVIVAGGFTATLQDNVCASMGLDVKASSGSWTTNETTMGWKALTSDELVATDTGVTINLTNLYDEAWIKLNIDVQDTGTFFTSENATYNQTTGMWEKDPNDGPVVVKLLPDGSEESAAIAKDEARTDIPWIFKGHTVTATVITGPETGNIYINGIETNSLSVAAGYSPEVLFYGKTGYVLNYLEVDGQVLTDYDPSLINWIFQNIQTDHDIKVGYVKANLKLLRAVQRYPWNNLVDIDYYIGATDSADGIMSGRLVFFVTYEDEDGKTVKKQLRTFRDNKLMYYNAPFADSSIININSDAQVDLHRIGYHRVTWDSNADGISIFQKKKIGYSLIACPGTDKTK